MEDSYSSDFLSRVHGVLVVDQIALRFPKNLYAIQSTPRSCKFRASC